MCRINKTDLNEIIIGCPKTTRLILVNMPGKGNNRGQFTTLLQLEGFHPNHECRHYSGASVGDLNNFRLFSIDYCLSLGAFYHHCERFQVFNMAMTLVCLTSSSRLLSPAVHFQSDRTLGNIANISCTKLVILFKEL